MPKPIDMDIFITTIPRIIERIEIFIIGDEILFLYLL